MLDKIKKLSWIAPVWKLINRIKPHNDTKEKQPITIPDTRIRDIKDSQVLINPVVVNVTIQKDNIDIT